MYCFTAGLHFAVCFQAVLHFAVCFHMECVAEWLRHRTCDLWVGALVSVVGHVYNSYASFEFTSLHQPPYSKCIWCRDSRLDRQV
jgi:hypothetical protein